MLFLLINLFNEFNRICLRNEDEYQFVTQIQYNQQSKRKEEDEDEKRSKMERKEERKQHNQRFLT